MYVLYKMYPSHTAASPSPPPSDSSTPLKKPLKLLRISSRDSCSCDEHLKRMEEKIKVLYENDEKLSSYLKKRKKQVDGNSDRLESHSDILEELRSNELLLGSLREDLSRLQDQMKKKPSRVAVQIMINHLRRRMDILSEMLSEVITDPQKKKELEDRLKINNMGKVNIVPLKF